MTCLLTVWGTLASQAAFVSPGLGTRLAPGACSGPGGKLIVTDMDRIEACGTWSAFCHLPDLSSFTDILEHCTPEYVQYMCYQVFVIPLLLSIESKRNQFHQCKGLYCLNLVMISTHTSLMAGVEPQSSIPLPAD